ncbi:MAG: hypothetical protein KDB14_24535 [Planctomycetales bacterium]|nr:hypothetical protein [Planctomycetales bacterium]
MSMAPTSASYTTARYFTADKLEGEAGSGSREREVARAESRVRDTLVASAYHPIRHIRCDLVDHALVLRGKLPSFFLLQVAQTLVQRELPAGVTIDNRIEVHA